MILRQIIWCCSLCSFCDAAKCMFRPLSYMDRKRLYALLLIQLHTSFCCLCTAQRASSQQWLESCQNTQRRTRKMIFEQALSSKPYKIIEIPKLIFFCTFGFLRVLPASSPNSNFDIENSKVCSKLQIHAYSALEN